MTRKADHRFVKTIVVYIIVDQGNLPGQDGSVRRLELVVATGRQGDTLAVTHFTIPPLSSREDCNATPYPPPELRVQCEYEGDRATYIVAGATSARSFTAGFVSLNCQLTDLRI